jgi:hypothetical protein
MYLVVQRLRSWVVNLPWFMLASLSVVTIQEMLAEEDKVYQCRFHLQMLTLL